MKIAATMPITSLAGWRLIGEHRAAELHLDSWSLFALLTMSRMCVATSTGTSLACTSNRISA